MKKTTERRRQAYQKGYRFTTVTAQPRGFLMKLFRTRDELDQFRKGNVCLPASTGEFNEAGFIIHR